MADKVTADGKMPTGAAADKAETLESGSAVGNAPTDDGNAMVADGGRRPGGESAGSVVSLAPRESVTQDVNLGVSPSLFDSGAQTCPSKTQAGAGTASTSDSLPVGNISRARSPARDPPATAARVSVKAAMQRQRIAMMRSFVDGLTCPAVSADPAHFQAELKVRLKSVEQQWGQFNDMHNKLLEVVADPAVAEVYPFENIYLEGHRIYQQSLVRLTELQNEAISRQEPAEAPHSSVSGLTAGNHRPKLPQLKPPSFSGEYDQWVAFRNRFMVSVGNLTTISEEDKFLYLQNALSGQPAALVSALPMEAGSFRSAWAILTERYENKRLLCRARLEKLLATWQVAPGTPRDLRALLAQVTDALNGLRDLGGPVDSWDWILEYQISCRLDGKTRECWEVHCSELEGTPTFHQMVNFLSHRATALESLGHTGSKPDRAPPRE